MKRTFLGLQLQAARTQLEKDGELGIEGESPKIESFFNSLYDGTSSTVPSIDTIRTVSGSESGSPATPTIAETGIQDSLFQEMYRSNSEACTSFTNKVQAFIDQFNNAIASKGALPCSRQSILEESIEQFNSNLDDNHKLIANKSKYEIIFLLLKLSPETLKNFNGLLSAFAETSDCSLIIDLPGILWAFNNKEVRLQSFNDISEFTKELKDECSKLAGFVEERVVQEKGNPEIEIPKKVQVSESETFNYNQRGLINRLITGKRAIIGKILLNVVGTCILGTGFMTTYNMCNAINSSRMISNLRSSRLVEPTVGDLSCEATGVSPQGGLVVDPKLDGLNWEIYKPTFFYPGTDIFRN